MLEVSILGGCRAFLDGREVAIPTKKGKALIGYLAFVQGHRETRERLVGMLWSEMSDDKARANLRQMLRTMRDSFSAVAYDRFQTYRDDPGFEPGSVAFDVVEVLAAINRDEIDDALIDRDAVAEGLLAGFEDVDPAFHTWLVVQRETLHRKLLRELQDRLASQLPGSPVAKRIAKAILQLDQTHEPACQCVMRALADAGDSAGAIAVYDRFCRVLAEDHDHYASEETADLASAIKGGSYRPSPLANGSPQAGPLAAPRQEKMILIVGALDRTGQHSDLAAAFRHELISSLSKFREWMLVDGEPAGPLGVNDASCFVLSVAAAHEAGELNLMLVLKDRRTGAVAWTDSVTIEVKTFYAALRKVMRKVAGELNVYTSVERATKLAYEPESFTEAYDRWLLCQSLMWQLETREKAKDILRELIVSAPAFAPGFSALAQAVNGDHLWAGAYRTVEKQEYTLRLAGEAVRLDPLCSRGQLALAWSQMLSGRYNSASVTFDLAHRLNEYDVWTTTSCALGYAFGGSLEQARKMIDDARALSPLPQKQYWAYRGDIAFLAGRYDESVEALELGGDVISTSPGWRTAALAHVGRIADAEIEGRRFVELMRRRWRGKTEATDAAIVRWFLHCFPLRDEKATAALAAGLMLARLPSPSH